MSEFAIGQKIGGYEILGVLGKGGMGTVYKANQTSMDRLVALKVLDPNLARKDPIFCDRFIDEARAAGRLNHPNIIGVHDVSNVEINGETVYYFSMEVVEGENFKDIIERDGTVALDVMQQVALKITDALIYAEQSSIVHRDIKPENIMIAKDGLIKLADLGLALQIDGDEEGTGQAGEDGKVKVMGTPRYMSPEQCRGKPVDHRTDQYCLGGSLFHMITGAPPYEGKNRKDLMRSQVLDPVPDPAELVDLPEAWRQLLMKMMAKKPDDRLQNGEALRDAVRAAIAGQVYAAPRRGARRSTNKSNNNIFLYLIIAFVVLATLGFMLSSSDSDSTTTPNSNTNHSPDDPDEALREQARNVIANISPGDDASHGAIRHAIGELLDVQKQGSFKSGDAGYQIIENEIARLEKLFNLKVSDAERDAERKRLQAETLIISGKFSEAHKHIATFSEAEQKLLGKEYAAIRSSLNTEIDRKLKQLTDAIERANTIGEIDNVVKEAKLKQVYEFRRVQIDKVSGDRRSIVSKEQKQRQQQSAAINKRQDESTWKSLIDSLSKLRATDNFDGFIKAASTAANELHDSNLKDAAKAYADIGRQAQEIDSNLHNYLNNSKPQFLLQGSRPKNVRCIGLDKDQYVILVNFPKETITHKRHQEDVPITSFLNNALSKRNVRQREKLISVYMCYWNHPYAGQYPDPFPHLPKEFPRNVYKQLQTSKISLPFEEKRYSVDFSNPSLWQSQFSGNEYKFENRSLTWNISQAIGGNPGKVGEDKLNFQTLTFKPKLKQAFDVNVKFEIEPATFAMIGLRRGNKNVRIVFNTNDHVIGAVVTGDDGKLQIKPSNPIPASDILDDDIRLEISMDSKSNILFKINGKDFTKFGGAANETFSLPGNGPLQLIFQGFKISPNKNGELKVMDIEIRQEQ